MPFTYTNRKGSTYYLCQAITKTGKSRYYFAREPKATPVEKIPAGYQVEESVNDIVSLVKAHPQLISAEELASVKGGLKKHPQGHKYRAVIKNNQSIDDWINAGDSGKIDFLGEKLIPTLGTDEFFELYCGSQHDPTRWLLGLWPRFWRQEHPSLGAGGCHQAHQPGGPRAVQGALYPP